MSEVRGGRRALAMSTLAFGVCFACWVLNGVLISYLTDFQVFAFTPAQVGWLLGVPVLTGSLARLPAGLLTDRYGGRLVFTCLLVVAAVPMYLSSLANSFGEFLLAGLGFGLAGASFAVGVAYVAAWTPKERMGTALGIFGAGNAGAAFTSIMGPMMLNRLTGGGQYLEGWRTLPKLYAAGLLVTAALFFALTRNRLPEQAAGQSLAQRLAPLRSQRVWRFGLYYAAIFGAFVAMSQWLIPYYVNVYYTSVATAGLLAACFSLPSAVTRILGGWLSDRLGARTVMYWVLGCMTIGCALLMVPRMEIESPGAGVLATRAGSVVAVSNNRIVVDEKVYPLQTADANPVEPKLVVFPTLSRHQEAAVSVGDQVVKRQLLARGVTHVFFQANVYIFTAILIVVGCAMGIGMAAVFKHIPHYFPQSVGATGGIVGVLGGLGGFLFPILFGHLLRLTGFWTSSWAFLAGLTLLCLVWMHVVVGRLLREQSPQLAQRFER